MVAFDVFLSVSLKRRSASRPEMCMFGAFYVYEVKSSDDSNCPTGVITSLLKNCLSVSFTNWEKSHCNHFSSCRQL